MAKYEMYAWSVTHRASGAVVKRGKVDDPISAKHRALDVLGRGLSRKEFYGEVRNEAGRLQWSTKGGGR